jgi:putative ABC transport system substrate-binding protein
MNIQPTRFRLLPMTARAPSITKRFLEILAVPAAVLVLLGLFPGPSAACEATVVLSAELRPYRDVLKGIRDSSRCGIDELLLSDGDVVENIRASESDVVVAIGTEAFRKVRSFREIPLVHVMVIPSEAERGAAGPLAGVSMDIAPAAWFSTMRRVFPAAKRVGLLYRAENTGAFVADALNAARDAGIELVAKKVQGPDDVPQALSSMQYAIDLFWMLPDATVAAPPMVDYLLRFSIQHRIPIITFSRKYLDLGAVASLDVEPREMGVQAGELVNELARGDHVSGSRYARKSRLSVNVKAAEKMGIVFSRAAMRETSGDD